MIAQAPLQNTPAAATAQSGQAVHAYVTNSSRGTWLFQPDPNDGGGNGGCETERPAPLPALRRNREYEADDDRARMMIYAD